VGSGGCAKEVSAGFPEEVAVVEDMQKGEAGVAVWACGVIAGGGSETIGVVGMKGVSSDKLEASRLQRSRLCE